MTQRAQTQPSPPRAEPALLKGTTRREELSPEVERGPGAVQVDLAADLPAVPLADLGPHPAGAAPPPCWPLAASRARRRHSSTRGPLSNTTTRHRRPPDSHLGRTPDRSRARRAPARTHGARRLHGAPPPRPAGKERDGRVRRSLTSVTQPRPGGPRGDWLRSEHAAVSLRAQPWFPGWRRRVARPDRLQSCPAGSPGPGPLLPLPSPWTCVVPTGELGVRDSVSRPPCWRQREGRGRGLQAEAPQSPQGGSLERRVIGGTSRSSFSGRARPLATAPADRPHGMPLFCGGSRCALVPLCTVRGQQLCWQDKQASLELWAPHAF